MLLVVNILIPPVAVNQCNVVLPTWRGMMNYWLPNKQIPEGTNPGIALRVCRDKHVQTALILHARNAIPFLHKPCDANEPTDLCTLN